MHVAVDHSILKATNHTNLAGLPKLIGPHKHLPEPLKFTGICQSVLPDGMFSNQKWQFLECLAKKDVC
jgi:hypothetical protein